MSAQIISGKELSGEIREELKGKVEALKQEGKTPGLAVPMWLLYELGVLLAYLRSRGSAATAPRRPGAAAAAAPAARSCSRRPA